MIYILLPAFYEERDLPRLLDRIIDDIGTVFYEMRVLQYMHLLRRQRNPRLEMVNS